LVSGRRGLLAFGSAAIALLAVLSAVVGAPPASAAGNGLYSIQPATISGQNPREWFNYLLNPGATVTDAVTVTNLTTQSIGFTLYTADAINAQGGGFAINPPDKPKRTVGSWITLSDSLFTLPPHTLANVPFTLRVPRNVTPGDYAGGIVLQTVQPAVEKRGNLTFDVYNDVGSRVYVRIAGPLHPGLAISKLSVKTHGFAGLVGGPVSSSVTYTLTNTGNQILNPTARLSVSPLLGSGVTVPPRIFSSLLPHNSATVTYKIKSMEPWLRLAASLKVSSGAGTTAAGDNAWVIPWLLILALVVIIVLAWWLLRRRRRKRQGEAGPPEEETGGPPPEGGDGGAEVETVAISGAQEG
jgi:hypothetical protein